MAGKWSRVWLSMAVVALLVVAAAAAHDEDFDDSKLDVVSRLDGDFGSATLDDVIPSEVLTRRSGGGFSSSPTSAPASAPTDGGDVSGDAASPSTS
ncbi:unnamed protein product [Linum trigynum]|uniref:Uncharacterized protein n=1 Tax=Linum trigynum TaxID=586398 RepID=A0AAV2E1Y4_9ROSI